MAADDLISTLERAGEYDALSKLRPDEPYFVLIGRDGSAPDLIDQWADRNRRRAVEDFEAGSIDRERYERECCKSTQAEMVACDMRSFKKGQPSEVRDGPRKVQAYSGVEVPPETQQQDALQSARVRAVAALNNAIAELDELVRLEGCPLLNAHEVIEDLREASNIIAPKRPGIEGLPEQVKP